MDEDSAVADTTELQITTSTPVDGSGIGDGCARNKQLSSAAADVEESVARNYQGAANAAAGPVQRARQIVAAGENATGQVEIGNGHTKINIGPTGELDLPVTV